MKTNHSDPIYHDEHAARAHLEAIRWPNGPICPHCGLVGEAYSLQGASTRPGLWKCKGCRKQFSVTVGTVFERSKIPLHKWVYAAHLLASSKKGISAHQIHRTLGVTYKTAWFMMHRLREAMKPAQDLPKLGEGGKHVEADETYFGTDKEKAAEQERVMGRKAKAGYGHKNAIFALVERQGDVRAFHISGPLFDGVKAALQANVSLEAYLQTDQAKMYNNIGKSFAGHGRVDHSKKEYVNGVDYTNTVENFFSVFKRGMKGIYQHCSSTHLHRYLNEFSFRYNQRSAVGVEDVERAELLLEGISHKRLMYKRPEGVVYN